MRKTSGPVVTIDTIDNPAGIHVVHGANAITLPCPMVIRDRRNVLMYFIRKTETNETLKSALVDCFATKRAISVNGRMFSCRQTRLLYESTPMRATEETTCR